MKVNRKLLFLAATVILTMTFLVACAGAPAATTTATAAASSAAETTTAAADKKVRIGISQSQSSDPWRIAQTNSLKNAAEEYGYEIVYTDAQGVTAKQVSDVEDIVAQGVDLIVLIPREFEGSVPALEAAQKANVPIMVIDRSVNGEPGKDFVTYIGTDFVAEAKMVGEWLTEKMGGKANIIEITGTAGSAAAIDRSKGFAEAISTNPDMKIIASQTADFSRAEAQKVMENLIQSKSDQFNAVFAHNDEMALGAIQAIKAAGLVPGKDIIVVGIDGQKDAVKSIIAGELSATATCNPRYGPITFETAKKILAGESVEPTMILKDYLIDSENAEAELDNAF